MTPDGWGALIVGLGVPLAGAVFWLIFEVRRHKHTLYGNGDHGVVHRVESLRKDMHWCANCFTAVYLHEQWDLPDRPSQK